MILKKITYTEANISPAFAQFVTENCKNDDCEYDNQLDAVDFFDGDITDLIYTPDTVVIMQANKKATEYVLRATPETMNLIIAGYVKHLEGIAANDEELAELLS